MIRPIDIRLNASHPELPLCEAVTYTGAPSTVLIRGVPGNCGKWCITSIYIAATFPDGSTSTQLAVQSANGIWVATLPATNTSGRTVNGLRIMADGEDENGEPVTGYVLGVADFAVASLGVAPAPEPGETSYQMLYFDSVPSALRKGDVVKIDGALKIYNGEAWEPFAPPITLDNTLTPDSANPVKSSGIWSAVWGALSALPTGFASLYDWCAAQFAKYLPLTGGEITGDLRYGQCVIEGGECFKAKTGAGFVVEGEYRSAIDYKDMYIGYRYIELRKHNPGEEKVFTLNMPPNEDGSGTLALLSDIYAAVQQIAPAWVSGTAYEADKLCSYNGVVYRNTSGATIQSAVTPDTSGSGWTAKKVSELFLPLTGGTMDGDIYMGGYAGVPIKSIRFGSIYAFNGSSFQGYYGGGSWATIRLPIYQNASVQATLALAAANPTAGNLAALDASGNPTDSGYRFEVRNGIPYIIETTND